MKIVEGAEVGEVVQDPIRSIVKTLAFTLRDGKPLKGLSGRET